MNDTIIARGIYSNGGLWERTKLWAIANPGKTAAIVTPTGTFRLSWTPAPMAPPTPPVADVRPTIADLLDAIDDLLK